MSLTAGARLGPYEVLSPLGAGGMGEVYRATDSRLNRTVAIKILSEASAADVDRRERFEREAKAISALDHPNICALYDVGEHEGTYFLVMPCLEGETLADRLAKGAIPVEQAIKYAIEIATALDAAHRHGIVHRDLKPGNIMLTKTGVKLLDFGLAKLKRTQGPLGDTTMVKGTGVGTLLGTMPYMAPEQIEGRDVDARSDIFALGAVIYEMVTGQRAFKGDSPGSVIGAILKDQPSPIASLQPHAPMPLDHVVTTCLAKDPDDRWQSAADVGRQLRWIHNTPVSHLTARSSPRSFWVGGAAATLACIILAAAAVTTGWPALRETFSSKEVIRFRLEPPPGAVFARTLASVPIPIVAISRDGRQIAFIAAEAGQQGSVWVRTLDDVSGRRLPETENAQDVFWSPDNQSIGFFAEGRLKRIDVASGTVQDLCEASFNPRGGAWNENGVILFGDAGSPIRQVAATGGEVRAVTSLSEGAGSHRWPSFLPDGRHFLFFVRGGGEDGGVYVGSLDGGAPKKVLDGMFSAVYSAGYLLTAGNGALFAYPFHHSRLEVTGEPTVIVSRTTGLAGASTNQSAIWVSETGVLVYASGFRDSGALTWFDRTGKTLGSPVQSGNIIHFRLSPNERMLTTTLVDPAINTSDIWVTDLQRGSATRVTDDPANDLGALWSRDGSRLVFRSDRLGDNYLFERSTSSTEDQLLSRGNISYPTDWSTDGGSLLFHTPLSGSSQDVMLLRMDDKSLTPYLKTRFNEYDARLSPNGRWAAYVSEESGRPEIHAQRFPVTAEKVVVSTSGGSTPRWRSDGKELFYLGLDDKVMSVPVESTNGFRAGTPVALFQTRTLGISSVFIVKMEVSGDGQRFLINTASAVDTTPVTVLVNWLSALPRRGTYQ